MFKVLGSCLRPELRLNTREATEFGKVEAQYLIDILRENPEMCKAEVVEKLAAGQPLEQSWLNDHGGVFALLDESRLCAYKTREYTPKLS